MFSLRAWMRRRAEKAARNAIFEKVEADLPNIVHGRLVENFRAQPDQQLPAGWFDLCLAHCLKQHWPDVDDDTAVRWLREYIGVKHGTRGYDWSYSAAEAVANEYASTFGEVR